MKTIKHLKKNRIEIFVLLIVIFQLVFPYKPLAAQVQPEDYLAEMIERQAGEIQPDPEIYHIINTYKLTVTAYSSTVDQTDSTPCLTANDFDLCQHNQEDVIAANFLPFGTKVRIPQYFGDRIFTVQDRMNARYYYRADVWMRTREAASKFGAPYTLVEVLE